MREGTSHHLAVGFPAGFIGKSGACKGNESIPGSRRQSHCESRFVTQSLPGCLVSVVAIGVANENPATVEDGCFAANVRHGSSNCDVRISFFTDEFQFNTQHMECHVFINRCVRCIGFLSNLYSDTQA